MEQYKGTIVANESFNTSWAAERFKKALKAYGTDETVLIQLLVSHSFDQREGVKKRYKTLFGKELMDDLKAELGGNFEETAVALMTQPNDFLAEALHDALSKGDGTDEKTVIEIFCNRTPDEIRKLDSCYQQKFEQSLEEAVETSLTGDFLRLMRSLVSQGREQRHRVDPIIARKDAQDLYDAGIGQTGLTNESQFIRILNSRSYPQLSETFREYEKISLEPIEKSINSEFSGDLRQGLLAIVQRVKDPLGFFAERLNESMRGAGTDDRTLIRIITTRSEIDLEDIKTRYKAMYGSSLISDIRADSSGDYGRLLMAVVGT